MLQGHSQDFSRGMHNFLNISFKIQSTNVNHVTSLETHIISVVKKNVCMFQN